MQGQKTAYIDDLSFFDSRTIDPADRVQPFFDHPQKEDFRLTETLKKELDDFGTASFLVLKDGKILFEQYWDEYSNESQTNSFSMAKTVVTLLLGAAIEDGYVKNLEQPITDFLPELNSGELSQNVSIGDFSSMTSGFDWSEDYYFPINPTAKAYFTKDLEKHMLSRKFSKERGRNFIYSSGDIQVLTLALRRAVGKDLTTYASEKLWKPLGIEKPAEWTLDSEKSGVEKGYCCIYANARTWGKLGQLMLQNGQWNGESIINPSFINKMTQPYQDSVYGFGTWLQLDHKPSFYSIKGIRGQRSLVIPEYNVVIVRLGKNRDLRPHDFGDLPDRDIYIYVDQVVSAFQKLKEEKVDESE